MAYAPGYDPDFAQGLEPGRPWVLVMPPKEAKRSGRLEYRDAETGARRVVPNVPYNQPAAWRAEVMRFYEEGRRQGAARLALLTDATSKHMLADAIKGAERCKALAEDYERLTASGSYPRDVGGEVGEFGSTTPP